MTKEEIFKILYGEDKREIYKQFKEIEASIDDSDELYKYFDDILDMLNSEKSSIRVRGFRLISKLSKYDDKNLINKNIKLILDELDDSLPTSVRQCLAALNILLLYKPVLSDEVIKKLETIDCTKYKDTMAPLIKKDIDNIIENI